MLAYVETLKPFFGPMKALKRRTAAKVFLGFAAAIMVWASIFLSDGFRHDHCGYNNPTMTALQLFSPPTQTPSASTTAMTFCDVVSDTTLSGKHYPTGSAVTPNQPTDLSPPSR